MITFNKYSIRKLRALRIIGFVIILTSIIPIAVDRSEVLELILVKEMV